MSDTPQTTLYCANHPGRETSLRCNKCGKPICVQCAVLTPIGYRCKECVRGQQRVYETATWIDYPVAIAIGIVLAYIGSVIASFLSFFTIFVAPIAGVVIAEAIRMATRRRRSRRLYLAAAGAVILGSLPRIVIPVLGLLLSGLPEGFSLGLLLPLAWQVLYVFLVVPSFYYRLSGIQL
jgi:hypothetical protein